MCWENVGMRGYSVVGFKMEEARGEGPESLSYEQTVTLNHQSTAEWESQAAAAAAAKLLQSCLTLCDPIEGRPAGFPVPGILQARTLEWVAISFSNAWKWKVKVKLLSPVQLLVTPWTAAYQAPLSMGFSRQEYWSGLPLPSLNFRLSETNRKEIDLVKNPTEFEVRFSLPDPPCKMSAQSSLSSWTFEALSKEHSWVHLDWIAAAISC